ncbi:hypothetical protein MKZ38_003659 [Zalerion maritima]|uniref:Uncharacterized protein n=1 Tax=Zalerion maritima TaxID=339359 RepID=A0AAD5RNI7_9PEZI|nr:hypothetical protein MKZ38_003659 [Zalerion maritima]
MAACGSNCRTSEPEGDTRYAAEEVLDGVQTDDSLAIIDQNTPHEDEGLGIPIGTMPADLQPLVTSAVLPAASELLQGIPAPISTSTSTSTSTLTLTLTFSEAATSSTAVAALVSSSPLLSVIATTGSLEPTSSLLPDAAAAAAAAASAAPVMAPVSREDAAERDPAKGAFLGGEPTRNVDLPLALVFLVLFALGAFRHISTYRANAKRGHKFLLSDLMFDFCMVRLLTCIFRAIWVFVDPRGVVLAANIFENGGASVIFAVNLFLAQRIVRAMHPEVGWHPIFGYASLFLIFSVPALIVTNIITLSVSFFSVGKSGQLEAAEDVLKFGVIWNMMLSVMPLIWIFLACAKPGPPPENFGTGGFRAKTALVVYSTSSLAFGAAIRLAAAFNPGAPDTDSALYSKAVFYITGFVLEILTVALYALTRIDLLFYVPDGSSGPGDYSKKPPAEGDEEKQGLSRDEVEREIRKLGVDHEVFKSHRGQTGRAPFFVLFFPEEPQRSADVDASLSDPTTMGGNYGALPPRLSRVSRRQSLMQAMWPERPPRPDRATLYLTAEKTPDAPFPEKDAT